MEFLLQFLITPFIIYGSSQMMRNIHVKDFKAAFIISFWIILIGFLIGWLLTLIFNILTLGIFWLFGLGVITRTLANAVVIEMVDQFSESFDTRGFLPSLWLSIFLAVGWSLIGQFV